jgi:predicted RNA-binding Zn-ribbon protein involved in translation (DUF1610 family)
VTTDATRRFPCASCGAALEFDPRSAGLTCPYCGRQETIPQSAEQVVEKSYEEYLQPRPDQLAPLAEGALEVVCDGCGATVTFKPPDVSAVCPFCGRQRVSQAKSADPTVAPQGVLPFALTKEQARESVKRWLASLWFAPNALKALARQEGIAGVYLPFWTFDAHTKTFYTGQRGTYEYDNQGRRKDTSWQRVTGDVSLWHDDVTVAATESVPAPRLEALEPWDYARLVAYDPAYLAGFSAQRYQVSLAAGFEHAKEMMARAVRQAIKKDIGGDDQRIDSATTSYTGVTFKHLLLPVYAGAYSFRAKVYQIVVNARSGEVQGERPYSPWKIAAAVLVALFFLYVVYLIQTH